MCFIMNSRMIVYAEDYEEKEVPIATFTQSEYDMYMEFKQTPQSELITRGYSIDDIELITKFSIEETLLERAKMSEEKLYNMNYNAKQIAILKEYDGSPIEQNPQLKGVFADLTGTISKVGHSTYRMKTKFTWEWSNEPLFSGTAITDIVACGFTATNNNNMNSVVTTVPSGTTCSIEYYQGSKLIGVKSHPISYKDPHGNIEVKFKISDTGNNGQIGFGKKGTLTVDIQEEKIMNALYSTSFAFGYGHSTISPTSPSIGVSFSSTGASGGVSLSFAKGTENMFYKTLILKYNGDNTIYNGN